MYYRDISWAITAHANIQSSGGRGQRPVIDRSKGKEDVSPGYLKCLQNVFLQSVICPGGTNISHAPTSGLFRSNPRVEDFTHDRSFGTKDHPRRPPLAVTAQTIFLAFCKDDWWTPQSDLVIPLTPLWDVCWRRAFQNTKTMRPFSRKSVLTAWQDHSKQCRRQNGGS